MSLSPRQMDELESAECWFADRAAERGADGAQAAPSPESVRGLKLRISRELAARQAPGARRNRAPAILAGLAAAAAIALVAWIGSALSNRANDGRQRGLAPQVADNRVVDHRATNAADQQASPDAATVAAADADADFAAAAAVVVADATRTESALESAIWSNDGGPRASASNDDNGSASPASTNDVGMNGNAAGGNDSAAGSAAGDSGQAASASTRSAAAATPIDRLLQDVDELESELQQTWES